ncbi:MAG: alkaline phosphatase family protein [Promethearchaeota archaeon]
MQEQKLMIIGLDCATPSLFFDRHLNNIPTIKKLQVAKGRRGLLRSSDPPITIPAWMCMATGRTPGQLGIYGFRHRRKGTYDDLWIASSLSVKHETAWQAIGKKGYKSIIVGIPPTYPIKPFNGHMISGFITPSIENEFTHPPTLKKEILDLFGHYTFDVPFRVENKKELFHGLMKMTKERAEILKYLIKEKEWDMFWFVEIGLDRMHHAFWKYFDENHARHVPGNEFQNYIDEYERLLDHIVAELINTAPENTKILVVSDHGAQPMAGCVCVNEWLIKKGYLALDEYPATQTPPTKLKINWSKTKAWGWGGYYSRIFFNVKNREPNGIIEPENFEKERKKLRRLLHEMKGPDNLPLGNKTYISKELYPDGFTGDDPDLYVYFGDLRWRSAGTVGHERIFLEENDTGPDDAVHAKNGIFIGTTRKDHDDIKNLNENEINEKLNDKPLERFQIYDIYPTILEHFGLIPPKGIRGKPVIF